MAREFVIYGPSLVRVRMGAHLSGIQGVTSGVDLGVCEEDIRLYHAFGHQPVRVSDFGARESPERLTELAGCYFNLGLTHYDPVVLDLCYQESLAGGVQTNPVGFAGAMPTGLKPLGNGYPVGSSGNHYVGFSILSPSAQDPANGVMPYYFPAAFVGDDPAETPIGTGNTVARVRVRAVPYVPLYNAGVLWTQSGIVAAGLAYNTRSPGEIVSSGAILWNRNPPF